MKKFSAQFPIGKGECNEILRTTWLGSDPQLERILGHDYWRLPPKTNLSVVCFNNMIFSQIKRILIGKTTFFKPGFLAIITGKCLKIRGLEDKDAGSLAYQYHSSFQQCARSTFWVG